MKIKVLFITNILCRHQVGIWDPLSKYPDIDFKYVCTSDPKEEISVRYKVDGSRDYVIHSRNLNEVELSTLIKTADVIFYGSIEDNRVTPLVENNSKAFMVSENFSKANYKELWLLKGLKRRLSFRRMIKRRLQNVNKDYVFCSSSHLGEDFIIAGAKKDRILKFGYYPPYRFASKEELEAKDLKSMFYVGREVYWKHPEMAKYAFKLFKKFDPNFRLTVCGKGMNKIFKDEKDISIIEELSNKELLNELIKYSVFIFPSDREEGWGNVLGEALGAGCICFANIEAGSTRYLIQDGVNGFIYRNKRELKKKIRQFLKMDSGNITKIREHAVNDMKTTWSGSFAADRLNVFIHNFVSKEVFKPYKDGPLSLD